MKQKVSVSILTEFKKGIEETQKSVDQIEPYADLIHFDIMDAKFVPPKTIGPEETKAIHTNLPKDVHLMCDDPINLIDDYADAGADSITFHVEAADDVESTINLIREKGIRPCISLKPGTPVEDIEPYLDLVDMVLVMTVEPGWPRQKFMIDMMQKVQKIRELRPDLDIQVDGGISDETVKIARDAGANVFVSGSFIMDSEDRIQAIKSLK